jgi:hypothetical protein
LQSKWKLDRGDSMIYCLLLQPLVPNSFREQKQEILLRSSRRYTKKPLNLSKLQQNYRPRGLVDIGDETVGNVVAVLLPILGSILLQHRLLVSELSVDQENAKVDGVEVGNQCSCPCQ